MRTSITAVLIAAVAPVMAQAHSLTWQSDYSAAQGKAAAQHKPLAIVFGRGAGGWQQLGGGSLSDEASRILAEQYVTCYVDTSTDAGRSLASRFELGSPVGLVISDSSASVQAFWHQGPLPADTLSAALTRYADPQRVVTSTDTNPNGSPLRYYPSLQPADGFVPGFGIPGGGMRFGGAGCPT